MENNPLRGLFGVSSPRPEPQLATPQPTAPTENIEYEIPSGMIEQLLANPYAGDGTEHPDMHLIYVEQICGLFKLARLPGDEVMKKVFPLSLKGKALAWYRLGHPLASHPGRLPPTGSCLQPPPPALLQLRCQGPFSSQLHQPPAATSARTWATPLSSVRIGRSPTR